MASYIDTLIPLLFIACAILNVNDPVKFKAAVMFTVAAYLDTIVTFQEANWFYYTGFASMSLLVYTFLVSGSKWSLLLALILLCSVFVCLLFLVNFNVWHYPWGNYLLDYALAATILELSVLVVMPTRILNRDVTGYLGEQRKSIILGLSNSRSHLFNKAQAR